MLDDIYCHEFPEFLKEFSEVKSMQRLKNVGMNCGCEYTNFPRYRNLTYYSRFNHSLSAAKIVWHFTKDKAQTIATLFHDISTPTFAHTIDFLNGDYLTQESTEELTEKFIKSDKQILHLLSKYDINVNDVIDYHKYPYCDNHTPRLSADRLEYTIGNCVNFKFADLKTIKEIYDDIKADYVFDGTPELVFESIEKAEEFAKLALQCSNVYVSDEDRFSMQILSEIIALALEEKILTWKDLYTTESEAIQKLESSPITKNKWDNYRRLSRIVKGKDVPLSQRRIVVAKKRYIDPFIKNISRLSEYNPSFKKELVDYLHSPLDYWISGQKD